MRMEQEKQEQNEYNRKLIFCETKFYNRIILQPIGGGGYDLCRANLAYSADLTISIKQHQ